VQDEIVQPQRAGVPPVMGENDAGERRRAGGRPRSCLVGGDFRHTEMKKSDEATERDGEGKDQRGLGTRGASAKREVRRRVRL